MSDFAFVANTNNLELNGLRNAATGAFVNDATVTVTIKDRAGATVAGVSWPLSMPYVTTSSGNYRAAVSHTLALVAGQWYTAEISATGGGLVGFWVKPFAAITRQDS
jgi:hypothetical protein